MEQSHFSLANMWAQGDVVTRGVAIALLLMSIASWYVIVTRALRQMRQRRMAQSATAEFWHAQSFSAGLHLLDGDRESNPFRHLAEEARDAVAHHRDSQDDLHGQLALTDWVTSCLKRAIDESVERMQSGLSILASVGSTAPFVGLLGTVWGIFHALISIGFSGQASIDKVAGPVGEALIMTAFGLVVAIPAVLGYNALTRGNNALLGRINRFAHDLHAYFVTGAPVVRPENNGKPVLTTVRSQQQVG
ncbi:MotA/TolQ/ExbB proton channel family protein [Chitinimonas taiwanensis]|jgi:biopolymer transport protein ExbB|uniref:Biopolymer transport protein ExbB n=1 Tax=Chitinimonas taiwanensis DSM 18899 TaxID=1121279 RepID=A0A1K2H8Y1_9NEIS|nr:MotA/TolQ/ExbB proton channel family protein [Chitinimonas taiwanensis]SFZ73248.1 outer membrane transport energization protein ExbB (TC 2.C.1.1.1) [Chitinimonas taiwanensis DSM 18899]